MILVWCLLAVLVFTVAGDLLFRRFAAGRIQAIFENVPPFGVVPASHVPGARALSIRTSDGIALAGSLHFPSGPTAPRALVIFFPELNGNHWMATHYCAALLEQGFAVLGFDFRNQGDSESRSGYAPIHWITEYEMSDVAAVLEFVESDEVLSTLPLMAFGVSRGGAAALSAACRYPRIRAVIADSAFGTMSLTGHFVNRFCRYVIPEWFFHLLPKWHVRKTLRQSVRMSEAKRGCRYVHLEEESRHLDDTAVLLISGKRDSYVTPEVAQSLASHFGGPEILWVVDRAKHNLARSVAEAEYDRRVSEHFERFALANSANQPTVEVARQ